MKNAVTIFEFLRDCAASQQGAVLVTLVAVIGGAARSPGAHMAVSETGDTIGSFSGGCVESAVTAEALKTLELGQIRQLRFGQGSPFMDIRLPCGGGIDLLFIPKPPIATVQRALSLFALRQPVCLSFSADGLFTADAARDGDRTGSDETMFRVRHDPILRLVVLGQGAEPISLLRLARAYGADTELFTPDAVCLADAVALSVPSSRIGRPERIDPFLIDSYSAVVALFHDHDWETPLLLQALESPAFFIGAMGSCKTHAERCSRLEQAGAHADAIARIVGPIGSIPAVRDPDTLAVSVLAQIVERYHRQTIARTGSVLPDRSNDAARPLPTPFRKEPHRTATVADPTNHV